jgi:hypothetical protein
MVRPMPSSPKRSASAVPQRAKACARSTIPPSMIQRLSAGNGVYAVRRGPHLVERRRHALGQRTAPPVYRSQRRCLSLITVGDGTAMASWGPLALRVRWAWQLRDRIARRFVARFRHHSVSTR